VELIIMNMSLKLSRENKKGPVLGPMFFN
jgi:hypothetical protein